MKNNQYRCTVSVISITQIIMSADINPPAILVRNIRTIPLRPISTATSRAATSYLFSQLTSSHLSTIAESLHHFLTQKPRETPYSRVGLRTEISVHVLLPGIALLALTWPVPTLSCNRKAYGRPRCAVGISREMLQLHLQVAISRRIVTFEGHLARGLQLSFDKAPAAGQERGQSEEELVTREIFLAPGH